MAANFIGNSYVPSIASFYCALPHNFDMGRSVDAPVLARFKEAMRDRRKPATQKAIADLLGISQPSVAEWNMGGMPTITKVVRGAEGLGVCVEWLYTGRGPKNPPPNREGDARWRELSMLWEFLTPDSQSALLQSAKMMRTVQNTADPARIKEAHRDLEHANHVFRERYSRVR